jgi:alkylhydroperoxidase family enzyme
MLFYQRSKAFDEKDKATLHFVQLVTRTASAVRENVLEELRRYYDEKQIVELTLLICTANFTNRFNDALQITPDLG